MDRDEEIGTRVVRDRGSLLERNEGVVAARENDLEALALEPFGQTSRDIEHEFLLGEPPTPARARVYAV